MTAGSQSASDTEREEPGLHNTMDVSPQRPPAPLPRLVGERRNRNLRRSKAASPSSTSGTYVLVRDCEPDALHNRAYGAADCQEGRHRSIGAGDEAADYERPLLSVDQRDKLFGVNMKRYILSSLGMAYNIPGTSVSCSTLEI